MALAAATKPKPKAAPKTHRVSAGETLTAIARRYQCDVRSLINANDLKAPRYAVQKLTDDNTAADLPNTEVVKRWWAYMQDIMECNPDNSPVAKPLDEVFHID